MIDRLRLAALKIWKAFSVVMFILHTQCSVNTIGSMSICMKNVGVKILVFMFHKAVLTFSVFHACFQTKIMFV